VQVLKEITGFTTIECVLSPVIHGKIGE